MIIKKIQLKICHIYNKIKDIILQRNFPMLNSYLRKKEIKKGNIGVVFMLHRVSEYEKGRLISNEDLKISPSFLQKVIRKYKKAGFDFLSLDDIYDIINQRRKSSKPFVSFTLDDGYLDNYTNAYPIFKKNNVPFCIFTATDFIDKKAILWWYSIEDLILQKESIQLSDGSKYSCKTYQDKWNTFRYLREKILKLPQKNLIENLEKMFSNYEINWLDPIQSLSMSWNQVEELSKEPLCTIGGHTVSHPAFNRISLNEILEEVSGGIEIIELHINSKIEHFAYPYGSVNEVGIREYEYMKKFNFKTVFVSHGGCISENNKEMTRLPRYMLKRS